jgi:hypothetical protein
VTNTTYHSNYCASESSGTSIHRRTKTWLTISNSAVTKRTAHCGTHRTPRNVTRQLCVSFNPLRSYVGPRPTLWFSCSRRVYWSLTLSNPIFLPPAYSPALVYFGRERGWWITCNYPTVLKEKNINRKSTTCAICWLHEEKRREQENHNVGRDPT